MKRLILAAAVLLGVTALPALAQGTIVYEGNDIELPAELGPVQCLVVARDEVRHEDLKGVTIDATTYGAIFIRDADHGWLLAGKVKEPAVGEWDIKVGESCDHAIGGGE